jgi:CDP-diacylglycerol---serine O-phosphatidyltransferase
MRLLSIAFPFLRFLDLANGITAFNIGLSIATVALAWSGHLSAAATAMCLAAAVDFLDGHIARTHLADRSLNRAFGKHLDSLADLLNFSVAPALLLVQVAGSVLSGVLAGGLVLSGALRLAVFGATSPPAPTSYTGLPTTYSGLLFALAFQVLAAGRMPLAALLALAGLIAVLQLSNLRVPKFKAIPTVASIVLSFATVTLLVHNT